MTESAVYKLRKHVEQVDDGIEADEDVGDDFESLYKGEISKSGTPIPVSYTHLRAHETDSYLVCRLLLECWCCLLIHQDRLLKPVFFLEFSLLFLMVI